jgi:hypothetical protein
VDHSTTSTSRRAFLRTTGAAGATLAAGAALASGAAPGVASAAETSTSPPTTQLGNFFYPDQPKRPTDDDLLSLGFVNSLSRAAAQIYDGVVTAKTAESANVILISFRENHRSQAEAVSALGGSPITAVANRTLVADYSSAALQSAPLAMLIKLEVSLLATFNDILGKITSTDGAALIASITPILAQQLVVLGETAQDPQADYLPSFDDTTGALTTDGYPVERV